MHTYKHSLSNLYTSGGGGDGGRNKSRSTAIQSSQPANNIAPHPVCTHNL